MEKLLSNKKVILLFVLPGFVVFAVMFFLPIIATFALSLTKWEIVKTPVFIGLENYRRMIFNDPVFLTGLRNIFILLLAVVCIQLPIALILALLVAQCTKGIRILKTTFFIPMVFSATAVGLVWLRIYDPTYGIINRFFDALNIAYQQKWLSNATTAIIAICGPLIWCKIGYYLIIFYAGIKSIPKDYYEAALLDGCTGIHATVKITIPLLSNIISMCVVLGAIGALREYPLIYVMTLGGPFKSTFTPAIEMYVKSFIEMNFGYGSALAASLVIISMITAKLLRMIFPANKIQY